MSILKNDSSDWDYHIFDCDTASQEFGAFQSFAELWNSKRINGKLPAWRDFDITDFFGWYGWLSVCDISYEGVFDTHYRLWGTNVANILGYDLTGKSPRKNTEPPYEYSDGYSQKEFDFLESLARQPAIGTAFGSIAWQNRSYVKYEEITLPLSDDGESTDKLLFAINPKF
ncbi:MAG: hypothetical protein HON65_12660 [Rhodospirillales bacterium]|jgi:hypothetical protein|nr:hypothetical protein [Rhodospirillales bacterium]